MYNRVNKISVFAYNWGSGGIIPSSGQADELWIIYYFLLKNPVDGTISFVYNVDDYFTLILGKPLL